MSLQIEDRVGPGLRVVLALFAGFTLLAPYELLIRPGVPLLTWGMVPLWVISLGALSVGAPPLAIALTGPTRRLTFEAHSRAILVEIEGDLGVRWSRRFPFSEVEEIRSRKDDDTGGPPRYHVEALIEGRRRPLMIKVSSAPSEAEALIAELRRMLAAR